MNDRLNDIWYMLQDPNHYVYHYTSADTLAKYILPTGTLRFSRFRHVNDPREYKNWVFSYGGYNSEAALDTRSIEAAINELIKWTCRVGCFVSDPYEALVTRERENKGEDVVGAIYERGHSRPRMWAQYGRDHTGACLVFEKTKLDEEVRSMCKAKGWQVYARKVDYRNPAFVPNLHKPNAFAIDIGAIERSNLRDALDVHITAHQRELFFLKARDWEQEREFRWLVRGHGEEEFYVGVRNSLVGIALGDRFPNCFISEVGRFAGKHSVGLATMRWKNGVPQLHPEHWRALSEMAPRFWDRFWVNAIEALRCLRGQ